MRPSLFDDLGAGVQLTFVQGSDFLEFDLFPDQALEGGLELVGMVVAVIVAVIMVMIVVVIVGVVVGFVVVRHSSDLYDIFGNLI